MTPEEKRLDNERIARRADQLARIVTEDDLRELQRVDTMVRYDVLYGRHEYPPFPADPRDMA